MEYQTFRIGFDERDKARVFEYWNQVFANQKWSHDKFTQQFEEKWTAGDREGRRTGCFRRFQSDGSAPEL